MVVSAPKRAGSRKHASPRSRSQVLTKLSTGIVGLDHILGGGVPRDRTSLVVGGPGCGKTLLATEFLASGAHDHGERGVLVTFQEPPEDLIVNAASIGCDLEGLCAAGEIEIEFVPISGVGVVEAGEYDLEALFIRIAAAVRALGAKRIVLDTPEALFEQLRNPELVRSELIRLFGWFRAQALTAVVTAERGEGGRLTRDGIEEYVSDCVILLDHRVEEELSTRRVRVLKYRGTAHSADEYPFIVTDQGISVLPATSKGFERVASSDRVSTGVSALDEALTGGVYRGSTVLVSGTAGTGKSTFAASFADAACRRGERTLYISYEESASQIERNMASVGLGLGRWVKTGLLRFESSNPTLQGVEAHLATVQRLLAEFSPETVVVDPITSLLRTGMTGQVASMLFRVIDMLKSTGATAMLTSLGASGQINEHDLKVSSLADTWLTLETVVGNGERNRVLSIVKSRGMEHSNQLIEVRFGDRGIEFVQPYVGAAGVLMGSARMLQELIDETQLPDALEELEFRQRAHEHRRAEIVAQVGALEAQLAVWAEELERFRELHARAEAEAALRQKLLRSHRWASNIPGNTRDGKA